MSRVGTNLALASGSPEGHGEELMMKTALTTLTMALVLASSVATTAIAAPSRPEIRQEVQQQYILTALVEGRLAWTDAKRLLAEQDAVLVRIDRFRDEGLSGREVAVLDYMLDISSRNIDRFIRERSIRPRTPPADRRMDDLLARR